MGLVALLAVMAVSFSASISSNEKQVIILDMERSQLEGDKTYMEFQILDSEHRNEENPWEPPTKVEQYRQVGTFLSPDLIVSLNS